MTRMLYRILPVFFVVISCAEENKTEHVALDFDRKQIIKKTGGNCINEEADCSIISLEVVVAQGPEDIAENINAAIREHVVGLISNTEKPRPQTLEALADNFLKDYEIAAESFSEEPPWEAYLNQNVYRQTQDLISIGITTEVFSGGAHGYKNLTFLNFDPMTGEKLTASDLFTPQFIELAEEEFRKIQQIPAGENINSTGYWFENDTFHLPENIGFTEEAIILVYNPYEIGPYATGDVYLEIPLEEAEPLLRKNNPSE